MLSGEGKDGSGCGKKHASGWTYRKYIWSRTRLRNKPTLIESVHRDLGQRGRDQVRPGHTPVLAKAPGLFRVQARARREHGSRVRTAAVCSRSQGGGVGCAELRPGWGCICVFMSVYIIYMGTMYTESTGALRDRPRKRVREKMPQIPDRAKAA